MCVCVPCRELSPLHCAVKLDRTDVVELLIKAGASVSKNIKTFPSFILYFSLKYINNKHSHNK